MTEGLDTDVTVTVMNRTECPIQDLASFSGVRLFGCLGGL